MCVCVRERQTDRQTERAVYQSSSVKVSGTCGWQVNGVQMTGKSQTEAVAVLRGISPNSVASLIVSRQIVDDAEVSSLPDTVCIVQVFISCYISVCFLHGVINIPNPTCIRILCPQPRNFLNLNPAVCSKFFPSPVPLGLPGWHVEKPDTLDLFQSCVREPKNEDLDLYTYVYICISVSGSS